MEQLDKIAETIIRSMQAGCEVSPVCSMCASCTAHRAIFTILTLHKPDTLVVAEEEITVCPTCNYEYMIDQETGEGQWPCETILAIENKWAIWELQGG